LFKKIFKKKIHLSLAREGFKKTSGIFNFEPNLKDPIALKRGFKWSDHKNEISYFAGGSLNMAYNAVDRHAESWRKNKIALYWENDAGDKKEFSFSEIKDLSNKVANVLKKYKVKRGDRVFIFLPRIPELYFSFIGILKTGAVGSIIFQAFGEDGLYDRLSDSGATILITDQSLIERVRPIKEKLPKLNTILVTGGSPKGKNEFDFDKEVKEASVEFEIVKTDPDDYAFMLYTSGTTGKPVGVVHAHRAILEQHLTAKWALDLQEEDVYWCTADPGWITGIVYGILANWSNGITTVCFDGRFSAEKWYEILEKYRVTVFYTAPTAIRMLMKAGDEIIKKYNLSNIRHLASVGEALNPEAIRWSVKNFGWPFHETWWQTETGSIMICNLPVDDIVYGSMGKALPGVEAKIVDDDGRELPDNTEGNLVLDLGWPSMMAAAWGKKNLTKIDSDLDIGYVKNGLYYTGDRAKRDEDERYWYIGRADDVIKTSGERVGPFEVESALLEHPAVAESGVIGKPDEERGQIIKAFVVLKPDYSGGKLLIEKLQECVKKNLGGHAYPREIEFVDKLPKNRSGKIMRRLLRAQEMGEKITDTTMVED
jgi:acetyl-CoA synthetase